MNTARKTLREGLASTLLTVLLTAGLAALPSVPCLGAQNAEPFNAELLIRADQPKGTINRNIYGHFAEHLGRCVYDGIMGRRRIHHP